jgi:hypothetical protein
MEGYVPCQQDVTVTPDEIAVMECSMDKSANLTVFTVPDSIEVVYDGKLVGLTPLEDVPVKAGAFKVELRHRRFIPITKQVNLKAGESFEVRDTLVARFAGVVLNAVAKPPAKFKGKLKKSKLLSGATPVKTNVKINFKEVGETPLVVDTLPAGKYEIEFYGQGFNRATKTITVTKGEVKSITAEVEPGMDLIKQELAEIDYKDRMKRKSQITWTSLVTGLAAAGAAGYFYYASDQAYKLYTDPKPVTPPVFDQRYQDYTQKNLIFSAAAIGAGVLIPTSAISSLIKIKKKTPAVSAPAAKAK